MQAWVTLGRAQLNFGEPDSAIESFDKALALKVGTYYLFLHFNFFMFDNCNNKNRSQEN